MREEDVMTYDRRPLQKQMNVNRESFVVVNKAVTPTTREQTSAVSVPRPSSLFSVCIIPMIRGAVVASKTVPLSHATNKNTTRAKVHTEARCSESLPTIFLQLYATSPNQALKLFYITKLFTHLVFDGT